MRIGIKEGVASDKIVVTKQQRPKEEDENPGNYQQRDQVGPLAISQVKIAFKQVMFVRE